jgi:hypothetical protein
MRCWDRERSRREYKSSCDECLDRRINQTETSARARWECGSCVWERPFKSNVLSGCPTFKK